MTSVLEDKKIKVFDKDKEFFVIDSNNLSNIETKLYGYCIVGDTVVNNTADVKIDLLNGMGLYVYVENNGKNIKIMQDYIGSYGLYLFKKDSYFAISNSFQYLVDYLKKDYKLTLNKDCANAIMVTGLCSLATKETLINEITILNKREIVEIDIKEKIYKSTFFDYKEHSIEPDTEEGLAILDDWYNRWSAIFSKYAKDKSFCADLSGGFDSRLTFMLLNASNVDINNIYISSTNDNRHTHVEDYEIASEIANHYGFCLNNKADFNPDIDEKYLENLFELYSYIKLGFHKINSIFRSDSKYILRGSGGECLRDFWTRTKQGIIDCFSPDIKYFFRKSSNKTKAMIKNSLETVINNSYNDIKTTYMTLGKDFKEEFFGQYLYDEVRSRYHFGKGDLTRYFSGLLVFAPLYDVQLLKLKLSSSKSQDKNTLVALIFNRYSNLLNFKFQGGRSIDKKTIDYVTQINNKYPFEKREHFYKKNDKDKFILDPDLPFRLTEKFLNYTYKLYKTKRVKSAVIRLFGFHLYYKLHRVAQRKKPDWERPIYASLAVVKAYQDCSDNKVFSENLIDNFIDEPSLWDRCIGYIQNKMNLKD